MCIRDRLYGKQLSIVFYRRVRDEQRFESLEALQAQLTVDADTVRQMLNETP